MGKKINFLGIEVEVVSDEEMAQAPEGSVYMLMRVADSDASFGSPALKKRRMRVRCDDCRAVCWFDPLGGWLSLPQGTARVCMQCVRVRGQGLEKDQPS